MSAVKRKTKLKAVCYCRTSSDDGDLERKKKQEKDAPIDPLAKREKIRVKHKESIAEQVKLCRDRAEKLGYETSEDDIYIDQNISGRTYPHGHEIPDPAFDDYFDSHIKRPIKRTRHGLGKLLDRKDIDVIVVRDIYRIFRPAFQSHLGNHIWQLITRRKIHIHSVEDGDIDSTKFEDLMITNLKLQIADQAKRQEVAAARRSLRAKKDAGYLASGVKCFGFEYGGHQTVKAKPTELKIVKSIFQRYLDGEDISKIARWINDVEKVQTSTGNPWTVNQVRKILIRPWYAGLQYNSEKELIDSKVFPSGDQATVTPEEFHRVQYSFQARMRHETRSESDIKREAEQIAQGKHPRGGQGIGKAFTTEPSPRKKGPKKRTYKRGPIHAFSGLAKCGNCGKHLYISKLVNQYYLDGRNKLQMHVEKDDMGRDLVQVTTYHYSCKSAQTTKDEKYQACNQSRIKEEYPRESLNMGITPNGLGLIECLWPLLFHGHIARYVRRKTTAPGLEEKRSSLTYQLSQLEAREVRLFDQQNEGVVDDGQFALGMQRTRDKRSKLSSQLDAVLAEVAILNDSATKIPDKIFLDPKETSREVIQELAHEAFEEILVFPDKIRVRLKLSEDNVRPGTPQCIDIPRVKRRNARNLPFWKARISTAEITPDTKLGVTYYLKSTDKENYNQIQLAYHDKNMEVLLVGTNESIDKERSKAEPAPELVNEIIKFAFGPPPGYDRILEVNKDASMAKWIVPMKDMYPAEALVEAFPHLGPIPEEADAERKETLSITPPDALMDIPDGPLKR